MPLQLTEEAVTTAVQSDWYYSIELLPDRFTRGREFANVALTRRLLQRCGIAGQRCLDIGTMEGLVPVLLCRQGAKEVVAIDALNLSSSIAIVKAAYDTDFEYYPGISSAHMYRFLTDRAMLKTVTGDAPEFGFDVVVLSGVLYHVFSPLHVLGAARSCLRAGGLLVIETAAVNARSYHLQHNFTGERYIYGWTDTWFPSLNLLDYLCRFIELEPLDCLYLDSSDPNYPEIIRVGVVCRATDRILSEPAEYLMEDSARNLEYYTLLKMNLPGRCGNTDVPYDGSAGNIIRRAHTGTCDIWSSVQANPAMHYTRDDIILRLHHVA